MKLGRVLSCAVILALVIPLTGCEKVQSVFTPKPKVITREATVAVESAPVTGKPLDDAPEGLPLWPGARVRLSYEQKGTYRLVYITEDTFSDVIAGLSVGFERAGWSVSKAATEQTATVLDVAGPKHEGIVTVYDEEPKRRVEYLLIGTSE